MPSLYCSDASGVSWRHRHRRRQANASLFPIEDGNGRPALRGRSGDVAAAALDEDLRWPVATASRGGGREEFHRTGPIPARIGVEACLVGLDPRRLGRILGHPDELVDCETLHATVD